MKKILIRTYLRTQKIYYSFYLFVKENSLYRFIDKKVSFQPVKQEIIYRLGKGLKQSNKQKPIEKTKIAQKNWDIVFISQKASPDIIKDIIAIKSIRPEIKACLLTSDIAQVKTLANDYFDEIIYYDNKYDLILYVKEINCDNLIARRGDEYQVYLVTLFFENKIIYRPYPFIARYPKHVWGEDKNFCEREIIKKSKGIYHFYDKTAENFLKARYNIECPMIIVRSECLQDINIDFSKDKLSKRDGEIHIVYAAGIQRNNSQKNITGHSNQYEKFKYILNQGIHLHWYQAYPRESDKSHGLKKYFDLANEFTNFHREDPLEYHKLLNILPIYDWAFLHFSAEEVPLRKEFNYGYSNGLYTHIQSGNLLIVSSQSLGYKKIINEYNIGLALDRSEDFKNLNPMLKAYDYNSALKNMNYAKNELAYPKEEFYKFLFGKEK